MSDRDALAEWWQALDGPACPSGAEFASAILDSDWLRDHDAAVAQAARAEAAAERAARKIAGDAADRFRDVLSECLGHPDENPGDDALVAELRDHFGKTGPEPTRWRDFCAGALAQVDQINADRALSGQPAAACVVPADSCDCREFDEPHVYGKGCVTEGAAARTETSGATHTGLERQLGTTGNAAARTEGGEPFVLADHAWIDREGGDES